MYKNVVLAFPAKLLQVLWWDYAFKSLKQEQNFEQYTVTAEAHVPTFLVRDDVCS